MTVREYGKFPCYGENLSGIVVRFYSINRLTIACTGTVVEINKNTSSRYVVGYYNSSWNPDAFTLINYKKPIKYNKCLL